MWRVFCRAEFKKVLEFAPNHDAALQNLGEKTPRKPQYAMS